MPNDDALIELVDECLDRLGGGGELDPTELRSRAGELWPELIECINLALDLQGASSLLSDASGPIPLPDKIDRFDVVRLLGQGGFSMVYLALDPVLGRAVALKLLGGSEHSTLDRSEWLRREANALARVHHSAVVEVFEFRELPEYDLVVMAHVPGPSLEDVLHQIRGAAGEDAPAPSPDIVAIALLLERPEDRIRVALRLADALAECHRCGVIHRDLKPRNVLLPSADRAKLIDFGISHVPETDRDAGVTASLVGTAAYMAPEQLARGNTGASTSSEIYSFGVLAHEIIGLDHPWNFEAPSEWSVPPSSSRIPKEAAWVLRRAMHADPEQRYPNMDALAADLRAVAEGRRPVAQPPTARAAAERLMRRHAGALRKATLAVIALVVLAGAGSWLMLRQERAALQPGQRELSAAMERVDTPREAGQALEDIHAWQGSATDADARLGRSLWFGRLASQGDDLRAALLARCEAEIARSTQAAWARPGPRGIAHDLAQIHTRWVDPLVQLAPDGRMSYCRLDLPDAVDVLRIAAVAPVPLTRVDAGAKLTTGRYLAVDRATGRSAELPVLPNQLAATVQFKQVPADWASRLVRVDPASVVPDALRAELVDEELAAALLAVPPFELLRTDVRWAELASGLGEKRTGSLERFETRFQDPAEEGPRDDPAFVHGTGQLVLEITRTVGLRTPTHAELCVAHVAGLLGGPGDARLRKYYWTCTPGATMEGWAAAGFRDDEVLRAPHVERLMPIVFGGQGSNVRLRLVR